MPHSTEKSIQIISALITYLHDGAYRGTLANVLTQQRKSGEGTGQMDVDQSSGLFYEAGTHGHWIPLSKIASFKKLTRFSVDEIVATVRALGMELFALSPDSTSLCKHIAFSAEVALTSLCEAYHPKHIYMLGVPSDASSSEVIPFVARVVGCEPDAVTHVTRLPHLSGAWAISFPLLALCAQALSLPPIEWEHGGDELIRFEYPRQHDADCLHTSLPPHAPRYLPGRILAFQGPGIQTSTHPDTFKLAFAKFSAVAWVDITHVPSSGADAYGVVVFRAGVVNEVIRMIEHAGGLVFQGEMLTCRRMEGAEECMYWRVHAQKEANLSPAAKERRKALADALNGRKSLAVSGRKGAREGKGTPGANAAMKGRIGKKGKAGNKKTSATGTHIKRTLEQGKKGGQKMDPLRDLLNDMFLEEEKKEGRVIPISADASSTSAMES